MDGEEEPATPVEEEESDEIVINDESSLPEEGKIYPKEAHPRKSSGKFSGLLPGGADDSDEGDDNDERNVKYFVPKFTPETIDEFLLDLMLCVRTSVLNGTKMADGMNPDNVPAASFTDVRSFELNRGGTDHKIYMADYASAVFHLIRDVMGVSSSAFLLAWSANDIKNSQVEGSQLMYSCDKRFVALPLLDRDLEILLEMLPKYFDYIRSNPNTLLLKMFGLVSVARGKKMCLFLLVENVFHQHIPLHFMYHLAASASMDPQKGGMLSRMSNTLRRRSSSASKLTLQKSRSAFTLMQGKPRSSAMVLDPPPFPKDKMGQVRSTIFGNEASWKNEGRTVLVEKSVRPVLAEQLEKDFAFLRDVGITDHKLVIGIHEGEPIAPPSPDMETKRLVKVPSLVVFQSLGSPAIAKTPTKKSGGGNGAAESPATPVTPIAGSEFDLSNLRRAKRVSVRSVDSEQQMTSPFRSVKHGLHAKNATREEVYYLGIIDIWAVGQKDKKRQEKAASRFAAFKDWINENLEEYVDSDAKPVIQAVASAGTRSSIQTQVKE